MNQFQEAALDRQEDRELRRDMADPVFLPSRDVDIDDLCHITVDEFRDSFWARVYGHRFGSGWGSCAAAAIREALKV